MKMRAAFLVVALFVIAFASGVVARSDYKSTHSKHAAYTITWQATRYDETGRATPRYTETRHVSSNGNWRSVRSFPDREPEESFAEVGRGVFLHKSGSPKVDFVSNYSKASRVRAEDLGKSKQFDRKETVLGQETYVLKLVNGDDSSIEVYRAPAFNGDGVKMVFREGQAMTVVEPISIIPGEPVAASLKHSDLPISYENFEKLHAPR